MGPLDLVNLTPLMARTGGRPEIRVGLIDGPVALDHPDLVGQSIRAVPGSRAAACSRANSVACTHGTFVMGILAARRGSAAPAICPDCTFLARPIFSETGSANGHLPSATPDELSAALVETIDAGARLVNVSAALARPSSRDERALAQALDRAAARGVIVVVAAGNQGTVGSSAITRHPWAIPVAGCDQHARPLAESNLGRSIGRRGLSGPGEKITSLGTDGEPHVSRGTSAATPFVTGAIALLWSEFPTASATQVKFAVCGFATQRRASVCPPLLNAWAAYQAMAARHRREGW